VIGPWVPAQRPIGQRIRCPHRLTERGFSIPCPDKPTYRGPDGRFRCRFHDHQLRQMPTVASVGIHILRRKEP